MKSRKKKSIKKTNHNDKAESKSSIENIKNRYILSKIYANIPKKKKLEIVKYNKKLQNRLNLSIKDYQEYYELIEIEIVPNKNKYGQFININEKD